MASLEDIRSGAIVRGIALNQSVKIVSVDWIGNQAINVVFRDQNGKVAERTLYRDDEHRIKLDAKGLLWSFDSDGGLLRLVTEATRIKLAHHFDPYLAIHTSLIDPLPHQISAVYGEMLSRQPLRFLLADDPGAGKTIMAGLLMKELIARSDLDRCLVVAPGNLVEQWQDELDEKFGLEYDILTREMIKASRSGNPFNDRNRMIVRLDLLARNEEMQKKLLESQEWDMIVCDEAHRMSATYSGGEIKYTKRYQVGQKMGQICRHLLLMSATPHNGKEEDFQLFMALLDSDRFEGRFRDGVHYADTKDMMRRLTKEELLRFDGCPLFPERCAYTVKYELSPNEAALYTEVTDYVCKEMNRVQRFTEIDGKKRNNIGFALQILQRRLASSPAAIYQSLKRRRNRLEDKLDEAKITAKESRAPFNEDNIDEEFLGNFEEYNQEEVDEYEERISTSITTAETIEQLEIEVEALKHLEETALNVLQGGEDAKWQQLNSILDKDLMVDKDGNRRKLIIFTEPKDTLYYLLDKVRTRIGRPESVDVIHGSMNRQERRKVIERFMQDRDLTVLIANDAAGEGVNLQRAHLMVNYDLPWNPNKIEQRFGRIHRIGQTEVCHLWNIVAADTREGKVYGRLLEKLETAREALGGRVYDVLGELFEGIALKKLLFDAIQYGEQDKVREQLFNKVDNAVDQEHLLDLLNRRALTDDTMPRVKVRDLCMEIQNAEARRLQPHHIQSFFVEAFQHLGGKLKLHEEGRWEIMHIPMRIRNRHTSKGIPIQKKYERICFEKNKINKQPVATFICPGHPLLESVISIIIEDYGQIMKQGAILVDETDDGNKLSAIFLIEHSVQDGRLTANGNPHIISQKLQFAAIDKTGAMTNAGIAPHLDLRPANVDEIDLVKGLLNVDWLTSELEKSVIDFATVRLAQQHVTEVKVRRLPEIDKVEQEVNTRLKKEINYWDSRAFELQEEEKAGKKTRMNWQNAQSRAEHLAERLNLRQTQFEAERFITPHPPRVCGGMVVIPLGLLKEQKGIQAPSSMTQPKFSTNFDVRREIEIAAMNTVMETEKALGNEPTDVSSEKVGYDIASFCPKSQHMRFIEVKGRTNDAATVMLTRQEVITSLHEPDKYILAIVLVENGFVRPPRYIRGPLDSREPRFDQSAIQYNINKLMKRAEEPA